MSSRARAIPASRTQRKVEVGERLEALAYILESDFQILRVARAFDAAAYERRALSTLDPRHGRRERFARHLAEHRSEFERRGALRPEIYLAVRLGAARRRGAARGPARRRRGALAHARRATSDSRRRRGLGSGATRGAARRRGGRSSSGCSATWSARRVGPRRLAALIRRAYTRGLGEPDADQSFRAAGAQLPRSPAARSAFEPYGYDLLRLHESRVTYRRRSLARSTPSAAAPTRPSWCSARCPRRRSCPAPAPS